MTTGWLGERSNALPTWSWNSLAVRVTLAMEDLRFRAGICKIIWPRLRSPKGSGKSPDDSVGKNGEAPCSLRISVDSGSAGTDCGSGSWSLRDYEWAQFAAAGYCAENVAK
jgi:hypothetical protein